MTEFYIERMEPGKLYKFVCSIGRSCLTLSPINHIPDKDPGIWIRPNSVLLFVRMIFEGGIWGVFLMGDQLVYMPAQFRERIFHAVLSEELR